MVHVLKTLLCCRYCVPTDNSDISDSGSEDGSDVTQAAVIHAMEMLEADGPGLTLLPPAASPLSPEPEKSPSHGSGERVVDESEVECSSSGLEFKVPSPQEKAM